MATLSLQHVSRTYRSEEGQEIAAVSDANLHTGDRELVAIVGPSGSGKSTLLRMIAGLEEISRGDIFVGEKRVNDLRPKDRDVAMVFHDCALYPHMSVRDNLGFGLKLRKYPKEEIKKRITETARILDFESILDRKPKNISKEQRWRVAVGRAVVRQAKVLLLDHPFCDLEQANRAQMRMEIIKLHHRLQTTMLYATRDPTEAMSVADRVVVMVDGTVQQSDLASVVYDQPANVRVAGSIGNPPINLVNGTLKVEGETLRFREVGEGTINVAFPAAGRAGAGAYAGRPVVLGIRPEEIQILNDAGPSGDRANAGLPAIVDFVEPMGGETYLHLQTGAHTVICRSRNWFEQKDAGHRMRFQINVQKAVLFDRESGERLS